MRQINRIIVHCSATKPSMDIGVDEIRRWHIERGWSDIGYHWVIARNGIIEHGRAEKAAGAHARGHNQDSIAICLVGGIDENGQPDANYTAAQYKALNDTINGIYMRHNIHEVLGHRDLPGVTKACPCFDVRSFISSY